MNNAEEKYNKTESVFDNAMNYTNPFSFDRRGELNIKDGLVRRVLVPELAETTQKLKQTGVLEELFDAGLIRTWKDENFDETCVAHETLPFITHPQEWTLNMLQDAALCTLDISIILCRENLSLQDPHPWNVTFRNGRPVYFDFSSIFEGRKLHSRFINDFFKGFYLPLWLGSRKPFVSKFHRLSSALMNSEHEWRLWRQPRAEWRQAFDRRILGRFCFKFWRIVDGDDIDSPAKLLQSLRDHVAGLQLGKLGSKFGEYLEPAGDFDDVENYSPKARAVTELLKTLPPGRLLDLACNSGWFAAYATRLGHTVLGLDIDENAVDKACQRAKEENFDVGRLNIVWPTPPQGAFLMYRSAYERFQAETVLMVALEHHLVLFQNVSFNALGALAIKFGAKNLLIEWIPRDDLVVEHWLEVGKLSSLPDWYTEEEFCSAISKFFPRFSKVASGAGHEGFHKPTNRTMFLFYR